MRIDGAVETFVSGSTDWYLSVLCLPGKLSVEDFKSLTISSPSNYKLAVYDSELLFLNVTSTDIKLSFTHRTPNEFSIMITGKINETAIEDDMVSLYLDNGRGKCYSQCIVGAGLFF